MYDPWQTFYLTLLHHSPAILFPQPKLIDFEICFVKLRSSWIKFCASFYQQEVLSFSVMTLDNDFVCRHKENNTGKMRNIKDDLLSMEPSIPDLRKLLGKNTFITFFSFMFSLWNI